MPTAQAPAPAVLSGELSSSGQSPLLDPSNPSASGWLTTSDAAQCLGITCRGVRKAIESGKLKACKPRWLRQWLVSATDVAKMIEAKGVRHG